VVSKVVSGELASAVYRECKKIYSIKRVEIRKTEVIGEPEDISPNEAVEEKAEKEGQEIGKEAEKEGQETDEEAEVETAIERKISELEKDIEEKHIGKKDRKKPKKTKENKEE
jgi:hypothetical protein